MAETTASPPSRRVGRPRGSTRERILDAALDLFAERGYDKTSLREIADTLGFTKAALYYHFEHKEDILLALHMRLHELGTDALERLAASPKAAGDTSVWAGLLHRFVAEVLDNRRLFLFHVRNYNALESLAGRHDHSEHEDMEERLSRILSDPEVPAAVRVRMACALGAVYGALMRWGESFSDLDPEELGDLVRQSVDDVLRPAVRPPVGRASSGRAGRRAREGGARAAR